MIAPIKLDTFVELLGRDEAERRLASYTPIKDAEDIERYLKETAIHHSSRRISKTILYVDENSLNINGFMTLAISCIQTYKNSNDFDKERYIELSKRYGYNDILSPKELFEILNVNHKNGFIQSFLIGQLSRSAGSPIGLGKIMLDDAKAIFKAVSDIIGCRIIRIDCADALINYYKEQNFTFFDKNEEEGFNYMIYVI